MNQLAECHTHPVIDSAQGLTDLHLPAWGLIDSGTELMSLACYDFCSKPDLKGIQLFLCRLFPSDLATEPEKFYLEPLTPIDLQDT